MLRVGLRVRLRVKPEGLRVRVRVRPEGLRGLRVRVAKGKGRLRVGCLRVRVRVRGGVALSPLPSPFHPPGVLITTSLA